MRRVFCACGFQQVTDSKDLAFDVAVSHRATHNRSFLDTKISPEFESLEANNASNKRKAKTKMFKIESGFELPEATRKGKTEKYPFSQMEVKQSFFVSNIEGKDNIETAKTVSHAAYSAEKRLEAKGTKVRFTVRPVTEERVVEGNDGEEPTIVEVLGTRVWRAE